MAKVDIIGKGWKGTVIFTGVSDKGEDWIRRHWFSNEFETNDYRNAATHIETMNKDGLSVVINFGA